MKVKVCHLGLLLVVVYSSVVTMWSKEIDQAFSVFQFQITFWDDGVYISVLEDIPC